jgi:sulfate transport system substrate-binding protein
MMSRIRKVSVIGLVAAVAATAVGVAGSAMAAPKAAKDVKLSLAAYSTPKEAYADIIKAFQATPAGAGVTFDQSYGPSGDQARAVANGLPADFVHLSLEPDVTTLVKADLVDKAWKTQLPNNSIPATSVVVFVLRQGNPKKITSWSDLVRPGIQIVTPNPVSSGGAKWNIVAAYYSQIKAGKKPKEALEYLKKFAKNIVSYDSSARNALTSFLGGKGDVFLTYENEAILSQIKKQPVFYRIPRITLRIDTPVAVLKNSKNPTEAKAFAQFLFTAPAQQIYAKWGYRPVNKAVGETTKFPPRPGLFTIEDKFLGGWSKVDPFLFQYTKGLWTQIASSGGVGS